ncbi:UNVERIFIED_CONTAM: SNF1-related protein kinase regulatory subunit gamma-1-like [Sesamum angustifolium]|uniref:SNF1-related protein kinase regulatory subunit gamma-1-like n=1 Tax=Sesamum angustifolium TaxID=2727405 RepID=A0AAW2M6W1_9LAMI
MASAQESESSRDLESCDAYFKMVQSRKKLHQSLQDSLTASFAKIPVSSFPQVPGGKVIEIQADMLISDAVKILSDSNILSAPVVDPASRDSNDWRKRYLGIVDYSAIILWVLQNAEIAAAALSATSAAAAGVGTGAAGALGALAFGAAGPIAAAGLAAAAIGAAVAGGVAADRVVGKDLPRAADKLGEDFYKVLLHEEPFKSATVRSILKSYRWAPFIPVAGDSSMLSVMLLLSKYRLRNVPVIETGKSSIKNFITQSAVIQGLQGCKGRDWFDCIAAHPISELGLPFMSSDQVVSVRDNELILEAFKKMKEKEIGGLPVLEGSTRKVIGNISIRDIRILLLKPELFRSFSNSRGKPYYDRPIDSANTVLYLDPWINSIFKISGLDTLSLSLSRALAAQSVTCQREMIGEATTLYTSIRVSVIHKHLFDERVASQILQQSMEEDTDFMIPAADSSIASLESKKIKEPGTSCSICMEEFEEV